MAIGETYDTSSHLILYFNYIITLNNDYHRDRPRYILAPGSNTQGLDENKLNGMERLHERKKQNRSTSQLFVTSARVFRC